MSKAVQPPSSIGDSNEDSNSNYDNDTFETDDTETSTSGAGSVSKELIREGPPDLTPSFTNVAQTVAPIKIESSPDEKAAADAVIAAIATAANYATAVAGSNTPPLTPLQRLMNGFDTSKGTHAVAVAGVMTGSFGRNVAAEILNGNAKMYAGVRVKFEGTKAANPEKWVYSMDDSKTKGVGNKQKLGDVETNSRSLALRMYTNIVNLAMTKNNDITLGGFPTLGKYLVTGTTFVGNRFQLLFKYDINADKVSGTGYIRYGTKDTDVKEFTVTENVLQLEEGDTFPVKDLLSRLLGVTLTVPTLAEAEKAATEKAATEKAATEKAAEAAKAPYNPTTGREIGGKSSVKKRRMSSNKGGRNNSASRKQNKKGGAKARRSQKAGKRAR